MTVLQLQDGGHLDFTDTGTGQPLVLLHGWSMRKEVFTPQVDALSGRFRTVIPDLRGHGSSSLARNGDGIATLARDVAELLENLELSDVVLIGWSMGAMVAWEMMRGSAAGRIAGIAVVDMVPRILNDDEWTFGLRTGKDASDYADYLTRMRNDWPAFTREFIPKNVANGKLAEREVLIDRMMSLVQGNDPESMASLWAAMVEHDLRAHLQTLSVPSLIMHGERGQLYETDAFVWLAQHIPNSRRVSFTDSGHAPHLEESDLFNATIEEFAVGLRG